MVNRRNVIPTVNFDSYIPKPLAEEVDARLYDPRIGKAAYGARGKLIEKLLKKWVAKTPVHPIVQAAREKEKQDAADQL